MTDLVRNALQRDLERRLSSTPFFDLRILDQLATRLEQLRALSWTRRLATTEHDGDTRFHLPSIAGGRVVTRCNGSWCLDDACEVSIDGPPVNLMCTDCVRRWARGKDLDMHGLIDLAHEIAFEDVQRAELQKQAPREMTGGAE